MVVLAIGVTPDTALAKEAGLELGIKGSIVVNDRMETSVPDIYAAGDAVQVKHYVCLLYTSLRCQEKSWHLFLCLFTLHKIILKNF